jgi:hypothetical protein
MGINNKDKQENWIKWNLTNIPKGEYIVTDFVQNADGVTITLDDEENIIQIYFDGIPTVIRMSVAGLRIKTCREAMDRYNDAHLYRDCFLYTIENSNLSKWAEEESCGFREESEFTHYCIVTTQEVVDVMAIFAPEVKVQKYNNNFDDITFDTDRKHTRNPIFSGLCGTKVSATALHTVQNDFHSTKSNF